MKTITFFFILALCCSLSANSKRVLFIGDSVTDGGWGRSGGHNISSDERNHTDLNHIYGHSYMMLCTAHYMSSFPFGGFEFFNRGIGGNTLADLENRWQKDVLDLHPDVLSILIGTNDVGMYLYTRTPESGFDYQGWERRYRSLIDKSRSENPQLKIILCTPFISNTMPRERQEITDSLANIVRRMAKDYQAPCVSFDKLFDELQQSQPNDRYWIWDGEHPTTAGHKRMADLLIRKVTEAGLL